MPWTLLAQGHAATEEDEKRLFRLLSKVFRREGAGTVQPVAFEGDHVRGNPLSDDDLAGAAKSAGDDSDDDEAKATLVSKGEEYPKTEAEVELKPEGKSE
jgi:hypothetical protein